MATLSITKGYADGNILTETHLDDFISGDGATTGLETFLNSVKLDDNNFKLQGITGSTKLAPASVGDAEIANATITSDKIALTSRTLPVGAVQMFHTYNGALSVPRGWMICNGDQVTEANYEAIHASPSGTWASDGIASSALNGKHLPNLVDRYVIGAAATAEDGNGAMTSVGNSGNNIDIGHSHNYAHNHRWYIQPNNAVHQVFDSNGTAYDVGSTASTTRSGWVTTTSSNTRFQASGESGIGAWTENTSASVSTGSIVKSIRPSSIQVLFVIKVI